MENYTREELQSLLNVMHIINNTDNFNYDELYAEAEKITIEKLKEFFTRIIELNNNDTKNGINQSDLGDSYEDEAEKIEEEFENYMDTVIDKIDITVLSEKELADLFGIDRFSYEPKLLKQLNNLDIDIQKNLISTVEFRKIKDFSTEVQKEVVRSNPKKFFLASSEEVQNELADLFPQVLIR